MAINKKVLYLIPGQGSDDRLFKNFDIDTNLIDLKYLSYPIPSKKDDMHSYSKKIAAQIDTSENFSIVGVSLGGMLALEMDKYLNIENIILIASAKNENELPKHYHLFKKVPIQKIFGGKFFKYSTYLLQPIFEPMEKENQKVWRKMILAKDPKFMKRALNCILNWENTNSETNANLYHIHGTKDKTIPIKNVKNCDVIENGTHVMTMTKGKLLSQKIETILLN